MNTLSVSARRLGLRAALRSRRIAPLRTYATPVPVVEESNDMPPEDYPDVPFVPKQRRPARGWEDPQMRRNFGEPVRISLPPVIEYDFFPLLTKRLKFFATAARDGGGHFDVGSRRSRRAPKCSTSPVHTRFPWIRGIRLRSPIRLCH